MITAASAGSGAGLDVSDNDHFTGGFGTGPAVVAHLDNASNASSVITAKTAGTGSGINVSTIQGTALFGTATSGDAVQAASGTGVGVRATANSATSRNPAVRAQSNGKGQAVLAANTTNATLPAVQSTSNSAVPAVQATGKVVPAGGAVATAGNAAALTVQGIASFTRSGTATVTAGKTSVVVNVPGGLTAASHVLATMQTHLASATPRVLAAVPNPSTGKITIFLDAPVPLQQTVAVAWFVFG